jgi:hypothetical protein
MGVEGRTGGWTDEAQRVRAVAHLSLAFVLDAASAGMAGLPTLDAVLVMAVNQANIAPLTRDPDARARHGALDAAAPDEARRPVSVSAVASSLGLPYETARRRLGRLARDGVCVLGGAGVVVPQGFLASEAYLATVRGLHERAWRFYREACAEGLVGELPPAHYATDSGIPIRGAARLLADYLLRSAEIFVGRFDDLVCALIAMELVRTATARDVRTAGRPRSITAIAQRLGVPGETVRRRVLEMGGRGHCARIRGGIVLAPVFAEGEPFAALLRDNAAHVGRLFAGLAERGVVEAWEKLRPTGAPGVVGAPSRA